MCVQCVGENTGILAFAVALHTHTLQERKNPPKLNMAPLRVYFLISSVKFDVAELGCNEALYHTHLILFGSIRSMSLSFFQWSCGGGEASTLHSNLTVSPSRTLEFNIFWTKVGGRRASWAAERRMHST